MRPESGGELVVPVSQLRELYITRANMKSANFIIYPALGLTWKMTNSPFPPISSPTYKSVLLKLYWKRPDGHYAQLSTGTGFIVHKSGTAQHPAADYLITNRHVLSGVDSRGKCLSKHGVAPSHVRIMHNSHWEFGKHIEIEEPLFDEDHDIDCKEPLWLEHPRGFKVDVVALPLTQYGQENVTTAIARYWYALPESEEVGPLLHPADTVHIVGFPFGLSSHGSFAIWTKGSVASEPRLNYRGAPRFLVDARTRSGQSGSPVILHMTPNTPPMMFEDNTLRSHTSEKSYLLGVYSGRVNEESDIGIVWKTSLIEEILRAQVRNPLPTKADFTKSPKVSTATTTSDPVATEIEEIDEKSEEECGCGNDFIDHDDKALS